MSRWKHELNRLIEQTGISQNHKLRLMIYSVPSVLIFGIAGAVPGVAFVAGFAIGAILFMGWMERQVQISSKQMRMSLLAPAAFLAWACGVQVLSIIRGLGAEYASVLAATPIILGGLIAIPGSIMMLTYQVFQRLRGKRPISEEDNLLADAVWPGLITFAVLGLPLIQLSNWLGDRSTEFGALLIGLTAGLIVGRTTYIRLCYLAEQQGVSK